MFLGASEPGIMEIRLRGPDIDVLLDQAEQLKAGLRAVPGTLDIKDDWNNRVISTKVEVDQYRARRAELTSQNVADSLSSLSTVTGHRFYQATWIFPSWARYQEERNSPTSLATLNVYSSSSNTGSR